MRSRLRVQLKLSQTSSIQYLITLSIRYATGLMFSVSNRLSLGEWYSTVPYFIHACGYVDLCMSREERHRNESHITAAS